MDHWIIFHLNVVSFITNNDNTWPWSPRIATDFDVMNKEYLLTVDWQNENVVLIIVNYLQCFSYDSEKKKPI